ncbi:MAG: flavodoxin family protein [Paraperlucidibaca sp.]
MKQLLIVAHSPSVNMQALVAALSEGAGDPEIDGVAVTVVEALKVTPEQVLACDGIMLFTSENLGYMSGGLKDFFDRCYYPVLERKQGLPCALVIRAGSDGTGTRRAIESIVTGLRWQWVQEPLTCRGEWQPEFLTQARELGMGMAAGLSAGIF